jgi:hypothetical protein
LGALSGRQPRNFVSCEKRLELTWSKLTSTQKIRLSGCQAFSFPRLQRLALPGAFPVKPGGSTGAPTAVIDHVDLQNPGTFG